ncbi:transposable element Tcb1 transposase [Trichonephila clavipes]|nr:transposable element Tcb1 transposase [Trichonephila clavipes]
MVWGAIAYNTLLPLVLMHGTMTAQWYVQDILHPHVFPLMQRLPEAIFQQTNARLQQTGKGVTRLPLHCYYPSFACPITRFVSNRAYLGWRVGHPMRLNELEARLQQIWNEMSQDIIQNSMPDRAFALEGDQQGSGKHILTVRKLSVSPEPIQLSGKDIRFSIEAELLEDIPAGARMMIKAWKVINILGIKIFIAAPCISPMGCIKFNFLRRRVVYYGILDIPQYPNHPILMSQTSTKESENKEA